MEHQELLNEIKKHTPNKDYKLVSQTDYRGTWKKQEEIYHIISPELKQVCRKILTKEDGDRFELNSGYLNEEYWEYSRREGSEPDIFKWGKDQERYQKEVDKFREWEKKFAEEKKQWKEHWEKFEKDRQKFKFHDFPKSDFGEDIKGKTCLVCQKIIEDIDRKSNGGVSTTKPNGEKEYFHGKCFLNKTGKKFMPENWFRDEKGTDTDRQKDPQNPPLLPPTSTPPKNESEITSELTKLKKEQAEVKEKIEKTDNLSTKQELEKRERELQQKIEALEKSKKPEIVSPSTIKKPWFIVGGIIIIVGIGLILIIKFFRRKNW